MSKKSKTVPATVILPPLPVHLPEGINLTPTGLAALAREVAIDIKELPDILRLYKLTESEYKRICELPFYSKALAAATIEWQSAEGTHTRIKLEAAAIMEDAMPGLAARMKSRDEAFPAAIEAGKLFAKLAGLDTAAKTSEGASEKFVIKIDLGADRQLKFEKDITPILPVIEQEPQK
jgi:hypothetical protein